MGRNLVIKEFDRKLGELVNEALFNGVDISTVVITLDKYLFSARESERKVLVNEEYENMSDTEDTVKIKEDGNDFIK